MKPIQHLPSPTYQEFCYFLDSTDLTTSGLHQCRLNPEAGWDNEYCTKADSKVCPLANQL